MYHSGLQKRVYSIESSCSWTHFRSFSWGFRGVFFWFVVLFYVVLIGKKKKQQIMLYCIETW